MTLEAKLGAIREGSASRIPPEKRAIMHRATEDLRASGIMGKVIKAGIPLPAFAMQNTRGESVRSSDLLARGPVVLTFFRGSW